MNYDSIFCFSDTIVTGAIKKLNEININVGTDKLVIGFDNVSLSSYTAPTLSTVSQPRLEIGETVFDILLKKIKNINSNNMSVFYHTN